MEELAWTSQVIERRVESNERGSDGWLRLEPGFDGYCMYAIVEIAGAQTANGSDDM